MLLHICFLWDSTDLGQPHHVSVVYCIPRMEDDELLYPLCLIVILSAAYRYHLRKRRKKRIWVKPWVLRRHQYGAHHALMEELKNEDKQCYKNFVRMSCENFQEISEKVSPLIKRRDTHLRMSISPEERLSLTLRYLATGDSYKSLSYLYRIPVCTLSLIIPETCDAIYNCLKEDYIKVPNTAEEWENIATDFQEKWQFPNCVGAMDGKHIAIQCPVRSGSMYHNYKQFFSIVLLAVVDADYKFIYVDCGCNGRISDGGVFANSSLFQALEQNSLNIPGSKPLPQRQKNIPYVIVGDEAFPLKSYIMKPYPSRQLDEQKRIFNYRLSRARRIVENVFGILTSRFGVFKKAIPLEPKKVEKIVLACCAIHNFLRVKQTENSDYFLSGVIDEEDTLNGTFTPGSWRQDSTNSLHGLPQQSGNRSSADIRAVRDEFCDYFNTNGQVPWQWDMV